LKFPTKNLRYNKFYETDFLLFLTVIIGAVVYFYTSQKTTHTKRYNWKPAGITALVVLILLGLIASGMYRSATAPDTQCSTVHATTSYPPSTLTSAMDYFLLGNYDYDTGNCQKAIVDYTTSIQLDPSYPQAYNNRAYTYMRMRSYKDALPDLDKTLTLNPNYIQALMNRGDIHNYYIVDRQAAISDYDKVISLGGGRETSVCGHLFLARHNGWNLGTIFGIPGQFSGSCK